MKNMKLTNLSLSVLVALGLVACGGSDSKDNAPTDQTPPPGDTSGAGNDQNANNNQPKGPTDGKDVVKKPTNEKTGVEGRFKNDVKVNFKTYANRSGQDTLAGYIPFAPRDAKTDADITEVMVYEDGSTSVTDIKRASSIVNYLKAGWVNSSAAPGTEKNVIRLNPLQTYALGKDKKYYRIKKVSDDNSGPRTWAQATAADTFTVVDMATNGKQFPEGGDKIPASKLVYIPNVMTKDPGVGNEAAAESYIPDGGELGTIIIDATVAKTAGLNVVDPKAVNFSKTLNEANNVFDVRRQDVRYDYVKVDGKKQGINATNGSNNHYLLDLGSINQGELTKKSIDLGYTIHDNKSTFDGRDDDVFHKETQAGELRIYDVNYSRALLEVNQAARKNSDSDDAAARNGLGFYGESVEKAITGFGNIHGKGKNGAYGPFQVMGSTTGTIPLNGRGHYVGKSFGVNSIGDIDLEADFGVDRATIGGVVENRTNMKGDVQLPDMRLGKIILSQPASYRRDASRGLDETSNADNGVVHLGGENNWGTWAVQLYGPNALSAAGVIAYGNQTGTAELTDVVEVFNAERDDLEPTSLNN